MPAETRAIPEIAKTAYALTTREFVRAVNLLGTQTVAALGLSEADNWSVNFETGVMTREIPEPSEAV